MKNILKQLSLSSRGLRYKLRISFYLMSVLPLLISIYVISTYMLPTIGIKSNIYLLVCISIFVAVSGFFIIKQVIDPIINISSKAKDIARGEVDYVSRAKRDDEIGDLEDALQQLTCRIKNNMRELEKYGQETKEINLEINRKVVILSSLLQVSSFISEGADINETLDLSVEKMLQIGDSDSAFLLLKQEEKILVTSIYGINSDYLLNREFNAASDNIFAKVLKDRKTFALNKKVPPNKMIDEFRRIFALTDAVIAPIYVHGKVFGLAGIGNDRNLEYRDDNFKLIDIFVKQITIAIENDILLNHINRLEVKDALTGLYNSSFIKERLEEEIKRAIISQRPCAFIVLSINRYKEFCANFGSAHAESVLKKIAMIIKSNIGEIDKAARFSDSEFAIVLPEKNKRQAENIAQDMVKKIEYIYGEETDVKKRITLNRAVSENPIDGINATDLINKVKDLLAS